jgi:hypothetical protein
VSAVAPSTRPAGWALAFPDSTRAHHWAEGRSWSRCNGWFRTPFRMRQIAATPADRDTTNDCEKCTAQLAAVRP